MAPVVEIEGLVKRYGRVEAVRGVSVEVEEGESFGYLGPNGSGKTTTIRCLLGLVQPTEGRMRVLGRDIPDALPGVLSDVGYLPGEFGMWPNLTGREVLDYLARLQPRSSLRRDELCERFDLSDRDLDRQIRFYSRGMKQKVGIVQAFQHRPPLVVLDEPTEGLDPVMKDRFVNLLVEHRAAGGTLFLSSHILSEVELATDRVSVLKRGEVVKTGPTRDLTGERLRHCTLHLDGPLPDGALDLEGIRDLRLEDRAAYFDFQGDMGPLIQRLAALPVKEFLSEPERLTEAFFDVYGER
ncbi:MAG TPA: ABC transporter ATP-binding protein [Actinomycetota bacterium]|nr:ABC transporter ATP-binding protein [Actinomycetota bacterium]